MALLTLVSDLWVEVLEIPAAGLMLAAADGELRVIASSSEAMRRLESFEPQAHERPCLACHATGTTVVNQQLATANDRCPQLATAAFVAGFRTVHSLAMRLRGKVIGALNLLHNDPSAGCITRPCRDDLGRGSRAAEPP